MNIAKKDEFIDIMNEYKKKLFEAGDIIGFEEYSMRMFKESIDTVVANTVINSTKDDAISFAQGIYNGDNSIKKNMLLNYVKTIKCNPLVLYKEGDVTPIFGRKDLLGADASKLADKTYNAFKYGIIIGLESLGCDEMYMQSEDTMSNVE